MRHGLGPARLLSAVAVLAAVGASPAAANTVTIGQIAPSGTNPAFLCATCTTFQSHSDAGSPSYFVPAIGSPCTARSRSPAGFITSWRVRGDAGASGVARLRVLNPAAVGGQYKIKAETPDESVAANAAPTFPVSPPIQVDCLDRIALRAGSPAVPDIFAGAGSDAAARANDGGNSVVGDTLGGPGGTYSYSDVPNGPWRVNIKATVYQWPPNTFLGHHPQHRTQGHRALFTFTSDAPNPSFKCKLDGAPFSRCSSPKVYQHLGLGEHTFEVKALDPDSNTHDPTPAKWQWRIHN
jgi:hypothetical protein